MQKTKHLFPLILLFLGINLVSAQRYRSSATSSLTSKYTTFTGKVYIIPFFIDTADKDENQHDRDYTDEQRTLYLEDLEDAKYWLLEQASAYSNVDLEIITDHNDSHQEKIFFDWEVNRRPSYRFLKDAVARQLGFRNIKDYLRFHQVDFERSKVMILCFSKSGLRKDRSNVKKSAFSEIQTINNTIVSTSSSSSYTYKARSIAWLTLDLFGAWPFGSYYQNEEKSIALKSKYPNSIMTPLGYRSVNDIEIAEVDELTAWRLGWNRKPKPFFRDYKPEYEKNMEAEQERRRKSNSNTKEINFSLKKKKKYNGG